MLVKKIRVHNVAKELDRDKTTIIRWEDQGLIPKAKRDSRGWRYYSPTEAEAIVKLAKDTRYFTAKPSSNDQHTKASKQLRVIATAFIAFFTLLNLISLSSPNVKAFTNQTTTLFTTVSAGILDIISASSSKSFSAVSVSFTAQTSSSALGALRVSDARGSGAGWTVNLAGNDWKSGEDVMQLDYDGTGAGANLGQLCLIANNGAIASIAGQDTTNITRGNTDCFSASVTQIGLYTASSSFGKGDYWVTDFSLEQYIPSNPTAQEYTTTVVLTIS